MFNLVIFLISTLNTESPDSTDYRIARFMLHHLNDLHHYNISQLAKECYVSVSSVSRFCRNIGYQDFGELKIQLYRLPNEDEKNNKFKYDHFNRHDIAGSYIDAVITNLQKMKESLNTQKIQSLVKDIHQYERVAAFGSLHSANVALNLQTDLLASGKIIDTHLKFPDQVQYLGQTDEKNLIIIFSKSGKHLEQVLPYEIKTKRTNKPKIWLITANSEYKQNKLVDKAILYSATNDYAGQPHPMQVIQSLISLEYAHYISIINKTNRAE